MTQKVTTFTQHEDFLNEYEINKMLGEQSAIGKGTSAGVFLVRQRLTGGIFALKKFTDTTRLDEEEFLKESEILHTLEHERIIKLFFTVYEANKSLCLGLELADQSLEQMCEGSPIAPKIAMKYMKELLEGVQFIHEKGFIHHDIKPANILLKENHIKICDFGSCRPKNIQDTKLIGTFIYLSPEMNLFGKSIPDVDVWSTGLSFYFMLSGEDLFHGPLMSDVTKEMCFLLGSPKTHTPIGKNMKKHGMIPEDEKGKPVKPMDLDERQRALRARMEVANPRLFKADEELMEQVTELLARMLGYGALRISIKTAIKDYFAEKDADEELVAQESNTTLKIECVDLGSPVFVASPTDLECSSREIDSKYINDDVPTPEDDETCTHNELNSLEDDKNFFVKGNDLILQDIAPNILIIKNAENQLRSLTNDDDYHLAVGKTAENPHAFASAKENYIEKSKDSKKQNNNNVTTKINKINSRVSVSDSKKCDSTIQISVHFEKAPKFNRPTNVEIKKYTRYTFTTEKSSNRDFSVNMCKTPCSATQRFELETFPPFECYNTAKKDVQSQNSITLLNLNEVIQERNHEAKVSQPLKDEPPSLNQVTPLTIIDNCKDTSQIKNKNKSIVTGIVEVIIEKCSFVYKAFIKTFARVKKPVQAFMKNSYHLHIYIWISRDSC